ncbi:hypothetical protein ACI65C_006986 [Semiaphis heraclei]
MFALSFLDKNSFDIHVRSIVASTEQNAYLGELYTRFNNTRGEIIFYTPKKFCEADTECSQSIENYELNIDNNHYQYDKKNPYKNLLKSYEIRPFNLYIMDESFNLKMNVENLNMNDHVQQCFTYHITLIIDNKNLMQDMVTSKLCEIIIP